VYDLPVLVEKALIKNTPERRGDRNGRRER
jgi:hypothetical protein